MLLARLLLLSAEDLSPNGQSIVFLGERDGRTGIDEALLLDAVAIYTRDLGVTVLRGPERRPASSAPGIEEATGVVRARGARLAFWCQPAADGKSIELVMVDPRRPVNRQVFPQDGPLGPELYRAVALKLRASLTTPDGAPGTAAASRADGEATPSPGSGLSSPSAASRASSAPPTAGAGARGPTRPAPGNPREAPAPAAEDLGPAGGSDGVARAVSEPVPAAPYPVFLAIDYVPSLPAGSTPWRHAAALHGIASLDHVAELDLGVEVAGAEERTGLAGAVRVYDLPVRLGVRVLRRASSYLVSVGVLGGLHALFARATVATPDRASESTRTVAGSLGLEVLARGPSVFGFAPEFRAFGEANLPNTRFLVRGLPGYEAGAVTVGFGLGVALPTR